MCQNGIVPCKNCESFENDLFSNLHIFGGIDGAKQPQDYGVPDMNIDSTLAVQVDPKSILSNLSNQQKDSGNKTAYQNWEMLSSGSEGVAYRAFDSAKNQQVEIQVPTLNSEEHGVLEKLESRLRLVALLKNVNVRQIFNLNLDSKDPLIVLEPVAEHSLSEFIQDSDNESKVKIAAGLALSLREAHRIGLSHGSINANTIRINHHGLAQIDYLNLEVGRPSGNTNEAPSCESDLIDFHCLMEIVLGSVLDTDSPENPNPIHGRNRGVLVSLLDLDRTSEQAPETTLDQWLEVLDPWVKKIDDDSHWDLSARVKASKKDAMDQTGAVQVQPVTDKTENVTPDTSLTQQVTKVPFKEIEPGERLGRFEIEKVIGEGGMGKVYLAKDLADESKVAVKVLRPSGNNLEQAVKRFQKEARLLLDVQNEYVTRLHDVGEDSGHHYLAMEFVDGTDLKRWLESNRQLSELDALQLVSDIAKALVDAHQKEIVHRDMKPENVLLRRVDEPIDMQSPDTIKNYQVKLSDFGIARHVHQTSSMELTQAGSIIGTPRYMSPEQCKATGDIGPTADVYSLGIILYELLSGAPPFDADDAMKLAAMHCFEVPTAIQKKNAQITDATAQIMSRALSKQPSERFADAGQFLREIERVLCGDPLDFEAHPHLPKSTTNTVFEKTFEWELESSIAQLWPYVSDTERLNRAIGLPPVKYRTEKDPKLGIRKFGSFKLSGILISWEEHPFEWIEGQRMGILREFDSGPFKWFMSVVSLEKQENGLSKLKHQIKIEPRNLLGRMLAKVEADWKAHRNLDRVYRRVDRFLTGKLEEKEGRDSHEAPSKLSSQQTKRLELRIEQMVENGVEPDIAAKLATFIRESSPQPLAQIRPLALAEELNIDGQKVVDASLHAASTGLLTLGWDILCPTCRAPAITQDKLSKIKSHSFCEACDADFESNLGDAIELVFQVHAEIRNVDTGSYCIGGPEHSPHVVTQLRLEANERLELDIELNAGDYLLRGTRLPRTQIIRVQSKGAPSQYDLRLSRLGHSNHIPKLRAGRQVITLTNDLDSQNVVRIERTIPRGDVVTASMASAMPVFRKLFPQQTLDQENPIASKQMTLLATTVRDVEEIYQNLGDTDAYRLIHKHLEELTACVTGCGGTLSKTVGEGLLAAFPHCEQAVTAAFEMKKVLNSNPEFKPISISIGVHRGPTLVATQNDRLDYFGPTARAVQALPHSLSKDILLTESVYSDPSVIENFKNIISNSPIETVSLPGCSNQRVQCIDVPKGEF